MFCSSARNAAGDSAKPREGSAALALGTIMNRNQSSTQTSSASQFWIGSVALGFVLLLTACATQVRFQNSDTQKPLSVPGHLYQPEGPGPFPAMVLLHSCAGLRPNVFEWARWLKGEGYVALGVDSFSPRGTSNVCGEKVNPSVYEVALDAFGALTYLRSLPFVDRDRIGVMGWSYGAGAALAASNKILAKAVQPSGGEFRVAVPFYPGCSYLAQDTAVPILLLLGEADDWTPPWLCVDVAKRLQQEGRPVFATVYPGAHHGFDKAELGFRPVTYFGYTLVYDPSATADAKKRIRDFLAQYLRRAP